MSREVRLIDERQLAGFRARELAPSQLYQQIPHNDSVALVALPPGVGKSRAAQDLVHHALDHDHDLVIYVAPIRAIIAEMDLVRQLPLGSVVTLEPRPRWLCGAADAAWKDLERNGCAAFAKATLCKMCVHRDDNGGDCSWPDQLDRIGTGTRLVVLTEQYLILNPLLIRQVREKVKSDRQLVILDEGLFVTSAIVRRFTKPDLESFREALVEAQKAAGAAEAGIKAWLEGIDFLLDREVELEALRRFWSNRLQFAVLATQLAGQQTLGGKFRYLAPDLELLNSPVTTGQWRDGDTFEIVVRVDTRGSDVIIMAPYLDAEIVEERLSRPAIQLFSNVVFRHSETRILNISDPVGTARTLSQSDHFNRVVDFFVALILRNVAHRRRTVLVTRKQFLNRVKARVEEVSLTLGRSLTCVLASARNTFETCEPTEVALINYGIVGINSLQSFDHVYCIGGYYARADHLNGVYQQTLPPDSRMPIGVRMEGRRRRVYAADQEFGTRYHARRAEATHRMIERRVVLQAIGRVRPFTTPAEVILFQCDDLSAELGPIDEFTSLAAARRTFHVPTLSQLKRAALGEQVRVRQEAGESLRTIAADLGISPSTVSLAAREEGLDRLLEGIRS
jgi:hypothetical protein